MDFTWWMTTFGPVIGTAMATLIGFLAWLVLRRILAAIDKVESNTADLPALRNEVATQGEEINRLRDWRGKHTEWHAEHPVPAMHQGGG